MSFWKKSAYPLYQLMRFAAMLLPGIFMARSGFSKDNIGDWEHVLMVSTGLSFFWVGGLSGAMSLVGRGRSKGGVISAFVAGALITTFLCLFQFFDKNLTYIITACAFVFLSSFSFALEAWCLANQYENRLLRFGFVFYPVLMMFTALAVYFSLSIDQILLLFALGFACKLFYFFLLKDPFSDAPVSIAALWKHTWPLGLSLIAGGAGEYIDAIVVREFFGNASFAVFRYGARELPYIPLLANALSMSFLSRLSVDMKALPELRKTSIQYLRILSIGCLLLVWASPLMYKHVMNPEFSNAALFLNVFMLILPLRFLFPQTVLLSKGYSKLILWITIVELVLNIGISLTLLPFLGMFGIVLGTVLAAWIERMLLMYFCYKDCAVSPRMLTYRMEWVIWVLVLYGNFIAWYLTQSVV